MNAQAKKKADTISWINIKWATEVFIILVCFLLINVLCMHFQGNISVNGGRGWDGVHYYTMAQQIAGGEGLYCPAPLRAWWYRVGTPFLASLAFPQNLVISFLAVNLFANLITVLLLSLWFGLWVKDWKIRVFLNVLFQAQWSFPVRFVWFYPVLSDYWAVVFILASLIIMKVYKGTRQTSFALALLCFIGTFFRETVFGVTLGFVFIPWEEKEVRRFSYLYKSLPMMASLAALYIMRQIVHLIPEKEDYSYYKVFLDLLVHKSLTTWVLGWVTTIGPIITILLLEWRKSVCFFKEHSYLCIIFLVYSLLTYYGQETERYLAPVSVIIYLLIGLTIEKGSMPFQKPLMLTLLVGLQMISQRIFWSIPDYAPIPPFDKYGVFLTPLGAGTSYFDLLAYWMAPRLRVVLWVEYLAVIGGLAVWYFYFEKTRRASLSHG